MFLVPIHILRREVNTMKRYRSEMSWVYAIRNNPIQSDPAPIVTDPNGSYTGRPTDPYDKPIQDADNL
jgi:hypothetical protein